MAENKGKLGNEASHLDFLILLATGLFVLPFPVHYKGAISDGPI